MANDNIDNLNFKVILDDADFDAQIDRDIELAKKLNVQLSTLLNVKSQVVSKNIMGDATKAAKLQKATADAAAAQEKLRAATVNTATAQERLATAAANAANAQERLKQSQMRTEQLAKRITAQTERQNKAYQAQGRILNELKGYAVGYLSIHGASQLLSSLVRVTGEFELQKTTLAAMLGDLNKAENVITRIQALAVESPFQFKELTTYAKQLSAFSVPAEELFETTKMLADVSAGLGVGMDRIVLAYGQVRSAAFLRGQEVRQFTEAGIPILEELAKQFTELRGTAVSTAEVFDLISKRMVPFEMVAKIFKDMTSEGGKFFNMQEVQAETLRGKISNLKDAYEVMLNEIGKGQSENLKGAVDWARQLMQNYEQTGKTLVELVIAYGAYKTTLATITAMTNTFSLANHKLLASLVSATKWVASNPYTIIAAGITAAGYAIYKNKTALDGYEKVHKSFLKTQEKYNDAIADEESKLDALYTRLKLAKKGTKEYDEAKKQIYTQYASYISELKEEKVAVDDLANIYGKLKEKVQESTQARYNAIATEDINQTRAQEVAEIRKRYKNLVKAMENEAEINKLQPITAASKEALWQYIAGNVALEDLFDDDSYNQIVAKLSSRNSNYRELADKMREDLANVEKTYAEDLAEISKFYKEAENNADDAISFMPNVDQGGKTASKRIEEEIDAVKRLKDAYDTLAPYMNGEQLRKTLTALFPNADQELLQSLDFRAKLVELAAELNKFDEEASQKLLDSLSGETAGDIASAFKDIMKYKEMLDKWKGEDSNLEGEGVTFDINKIIRDLNNKYAQIDQKRLKALELLKKAEEGDAQSLAVVRETLGDDVWNAYLKKGRSVIEELTQKEKDAAKKIADEKIRGKATSYTKELLESQNISLSELSEKTTSQLRDLIERIKATREEVQKEANDIIVGIAAGNFKNNEFAQWQMLLEVLEQLDIKIADTEKEVDKAVGKSMVRSLGLLSSALSEVGNTIVSLAETTENGGLGRFGKTLQDYGKFASDMTSSIKNFAEAVKGIDWKNTSYEELSEDAKAGAIGIAATALEFTYKSIVGRINYAYEQQKLLTEATWEYNDVLLELRREKFQNAFGTDDFGLFLENTKILEEAQKKYKDTADKINAVKFQRNDTTYDSVTFAKTSLADVLGNIANSQGWELYREDGELNITALEARYDSFADRLSKKQRLLVQDLIEKGNAVTEAATEQAAYLSSLFSQTADDIADSFIESFKESGDAALDYGDVMDGIATKIAKDLIKASLMQSVFTDEVVSAAAEKLAANDAVGTMAIVNEAMEKAQTFAPAFQQLLEGLRPYMQMEQQEETQNLSEGIKGITEDTANLLASYLNAIRADVSFGKAQWAQMNIHLQQISNLLTGFSAPSLMEYQAQIAANTFNAAQNTRDILSRIDMVLTDSNEGTAIRTRGV